MIHLGSTVLAVLQLQNSWFDPEIGSVCIEFCKLCNHMLLLFFFNMVPCDRLVSDRLYSRLKPSATGFDSRSTMTLVMKYLLKMNG